MSQFIEGMGFTKPEAQPIIGLYNGVKPEPDLNRHARGHQY